MLRLLQQIGQQCRQRRVGIMGVTPRQAISEVILLATDILLQDLFQIALAGRQCASCLTMQALALPVGQNEEHRHRGYQATNEGFNQSGPDQIKAVPHLVEAAQYQQRDRRRANDIIFFSGGEEGYTGKQCDQRLQQWARKQSNRYPADHQPQQGAGNALGQKAPCGSEVGAAHKQRGKQDPVTLSGMKQLQQGIAREQRDRHANGVTKGGRAQRQIEAYPLPSFLHPRRRTIKQANVLGGVCGIRVVDRGQPLFKSGEIIRHRMERRHQFTPGRIMHAAQMLNGSVQIGERLLALVMSERTLEQQRLAQPSARVPLLVKQALAAEEYVVVKKRLG